MASKQQGQVTKIYSLKTIGFPDIDKQLQTLTKRFQEVRAAKEGLEKQASKTQSSKEVDELNKKIQVQIKTEKELSLEIKKQVELRKRLKLAEELKKTDAFRNATAFPEDNSIKQAREANKQLRAERDLLNTSTAEGAAKIKELNDQIDRNNQLIKENVDNLSKQKINIGNYEGAAKIVVEALNKLEEKITSLKAKQSSFQDLTKVGGFMTSKQKEELENTNQELEAATKQYTALQKITSQPTFLNLAGQLGTARNQVGFLTSSLAELEIQGQKDTDQYRQLQSELARLTDVMQDTRAEIRALSSDTRSFDLVASGINTLTSTMQTAAGVSVLFGDSQEEVQRKIQFLLAVENVANGIRSIANDLTTRGTAANKAYAFVQGLVATSMDKTAAAGARVKATLGLLGIAATVIGAIVIAYNLLNKSLSANQKAQKAYNDVLTEAGSEYTKAVTQVKELRTNIDLAKTGFISKKDVVDQYNETIGQTTGQVKSLDAAEQGLIKNADAYIQFTLLKAAANIAQQKAAEKAFEAEEQRRKDAEKFLSVGDKLTSFAVGSSSAPGFVPGQKSPSQLAQDKIEFEKIQGEKRRNAAVDESEKDKKVFEDIADKFRTDAAKIAKDLNFNFFQSQATTPKTNTAKDQLNKIDALRAEQLAKENQRVLEIKKLRQLTLDEEIQFLQNIEKINLDALNSKIKYIDGLKKKDADELKTLAEFRKDRVETEVDTLDAIQKARDNFFTEQQGKLKDQLEREIEAAKQIAQSIQDDPTKSATDKAQAQVNLNDRLLQLQTDYNTAIDALEKQLNQQSRSNAEAGAAAIKKIEAEKLKAKKELLLAGLQNIVDQGQQEIVAEEIKADMARKIILDNQKLTALQKQKQLEILEQSSKRTILSKELENLQQQLLFKKFLLDSSLISNADYQKAYQAIVEKSVELSRTISDSDEKTKELLKERFTDLKSFVQAGLRNAFKIDEGSDTDLALSKIIVESFDLAKQAMNNFFDAEQERIQENLQLQLERLDMEKEQVSVRAQSQAEIESIEKQFAAKKRKAEIEAGEQLKKSRRAEAKIALAAELANIAVQASAYPFPASLIIGGILAALAAGRYALRVSEINREKFEKGGAPTKKGGQARGRSHAHGGIPFNYEAEDKELFIINKKSAEDNKVRTLTGTNKQIASLINELGGGISFASGAKVRKFESGGMLGGILQPPILTQPAVFQNDSVSAKKLDELIDIVSQNSDAIKEHAEETSRRIDRIEVRQVTSTVTNAQKKQVKQSQINSL